MSALGIRYVLPYTAGNGIDVNDGVISISETKPFTVRKILFLPQAGDVAIQVNQDPTATSNAIFVVDKDDLNNLFINGIGQISQSDNTDGSLIVNSTNYNAGNVSVYLKDGAGANLSETIFNARDIKIYWVDTNEFIDLNPDSGLSVQSYNGTTLITGDIITNSFQTIGNSPFAPAITFDSIDGTLTVPNGSINATINGTPTKIGSQQ